jgi:hypothetical protein
MGVSRIGTLNALEAPIVRQFKIISIFVFDIVSIYAMVYIFQ